MTLIDKPSRFSGHFFPIFLILAGSRTIEMIKEGRYNSNLSGHIHSHRRILVAISIPNLQIQGGSRTTNITKEARYESHLNGNVWTKIPNNCSVLSYSDCFFSFFVNNGRLQDKKKKFWQVLGQTILSEKEDMIHT